MPNAEFQLLGDEEDLDHVVDDGEEYENEKEGDLRKDQEQPCDVTVCMQCGIVFYVLRLMEHKQACEVVADSLNYVERYLAMDPNLKKLADDCLPRGRRKQYTGGGFGKEVEVQDALV